MLLFLFGMIFQLFEKEDSTCCTVDKGCLPFKWETRKFQLENQMVRIIPFGVLLKLWVSGQSDAFLLLLLGFTADVRKFPSGWFE